MQYYPNIVDKINNATPLPSLPHVLYKVIQYINKGAPSSNEIARLVRLDPSLTLKLFRLKPSGSAESRKISGIEESITSLGLKNLKNIILTALSSPIYNPQFWKTRFYYNQYWLHSLRCAILARNVSKYLFKVDPDDAYLAGLFHDIGKLVLWTNFKKDYEPIIQRPLPIHQIVVAESTRIGTNHCEAGCALLKTLNLNPLIGDAVLYHHWPAKDIAHALPLVKAVYAANLVDHIGEGTHDIDLFETLDIDLDKAKLNRILVVTEKQVNAALQRLGCSVEQLTRPPQSEKVGNDVSVQTLLGQFREICQLHFSVDHVRQTEALEIELNRLLFHFKLYFDVYASIFFLYDSGRNNLSAKAAAVDRNRVEVEGIRLSLKKNGSIIAKSLIENTFIDSFGYLDNEQGSIADSQLIDLMGTNGMLCIPLVIENQWIGVICAGINEPQFPVIWKQRPILEQFTAKAAAVLQSIIGIGKSEEPREMVAAKADKSSVRRVIHEVNNPIGIIKNYLAMLSMKTADNDAATEEINIIRQEIDRIPGIIAQLAENGVEVPGDQSVDINKTIEDLAKLLQKPVLEPSNIKLHFQPALLMPDFKANRNNLIQVFTNLLKNSVESMTEGGNIHIQTAFVLRDEVDNGGRIVITIRDDGPGIPDEIMRRLFEPGYSTKGPEHFGLGLSISRDIIRRYNGTLTCSSGDQGTTFKITLPYSGEDLTWSTE